VLLNIVSVGRQVFVPRDHTLSALRRLRPGEVVSLHVNRNYALREGLVGESAVIPPPRRRRGPWQWFRFRVLGFPR
jgi:hypothetical protein